jgi:hypothetical protein
MMTKGRTATTAVVGTLLNFVVVGEVRSGAAAVASALDQVPGVVCHGDLFFAEHGTQGEQEAVRREAHESYFGRRVAAGVADHSPEWFTADANPYRYLVDHVFDRPCHGECRVGVRMLYPLLERFDLYELLEERWREGDFCVVHVVRNPVACLVSARQATQSGTWGEPAGAPAQSFPPMPVLLDAREVADCIRRHESVIRKVRASCEDRVEVHYRDLVFHYKAAMGDVMEFLELPQQAVPRPGIRRLRNCEMERRILNFDQVRQRLDGGQRRYLDEDLF